MFGTFNHSKHRLTPVSDIGCAGSTQTHQARERFDRVSVGTKNMTGGVYAGRCAHKVGASTVSSFWFTGHADADRFSVRGTFAHWPLRRLMRLGTIEYHAE